MQKLLLISVIDQSARVVIKTLENIRQGEETDWAKKRPSWAVCREGGCRAAAAFQPSCWLEQTHGGLSSSRKQPGLFAAGWEPGACA